MNAWHAILLGALQGVTEFLPISSSGHLVLAQHFLGFPDNAEAKGAALFFDGMLHLGTLVAVLLYFRRALLRQLQMEMDLTGKQESPWPVTRGDALRLVLFVVIATLPAGLATVFLRHRIEASFQNPVLVAVDFLVLGVLLLATDYLPRGTITAERMRWWHALAIGISQAFSTVFRGLSRSGTTISGALLVRLQRDWAVRFSFLMSITASAGLCGLGILGAMRDTSATWLTAEFLGLTFMATFISGVVGYLTIAPLIALVRKCRLWWFSAYLWLAGVTVLLRLWLAPLAE